MRRAIELAKTATGKTFPNPLARPFFFVCNWVRSPVLALKALPTYAPLLCCHRCLRADRT